MPTKTKGGARRAPAGTPRKTKAQINAEKMIREIERESAGLPPLSVKPARSKRKISIRKTVVDKIPRKMKLTRAAAHIVVGTAVGVAATVKYTAIGAGKAGRVAGRGGRAGYRRARASAKRRQWPSPVPDGATPAKRRWGRNAVQATCLGCGHRCDSLEELNRHYLEVHAEEKAEPRAKQPEHKVVRGATARTAGKVIVHPAPRGKRVPGGKHRPSRHRPNQHRVTNLVKAYKKPITEMGERSVTSGAAQGIVRGFQDWADTLPGPGKPALNELQEMFAGLGRAGDAISEILEDIRRELVKRNIAPELVNPEIRAMRDMAEGIGVHSIRFLAGFNDLYSEFIRAAKKDVPVPDPAFFGNRAG